MTLLKLLFHIALLQIVYSAKPSRFSVIWKSIMCQANPVYVDDLSCIIHEPLRNQLSFEVSHVGEMSGHFLKFGLYLERSNNKFRKVVSLDVDVCKEMYGGSSNTFANITFASILRSSGHVKSCPIKGQASFRNLTVDNIPQFLPKTNFYVNLYFYLPKRDYIVNVTIHGKLGDVNT